MTNKLVDKIDKQIASLQKKLQSIGGNYLVNTPKRMCEEQSRQEQRNKINLNIQLLEYLKSKSVLDGLSVFENELINTQFREDMMIYKSSVDKGYEICYPEINENLADWQIEDRIKKQKRLKKAGINTYEDLIGRIEKFVVIMNYIALPIDENKIKIKQLEMEARMRKIPSYFPTPKPIVSRMIELVSLNPTDVVLEPSSGNGNIADAIREANNDVEVIEWDSSLREILELKGHKVIGHDFLKLKSENKYDKIIMNPPFEKNADVNHVLHAYDNLKEGGRIVAIMGTHFTFANDRESVGFREWLSDKGTYDKLPDGSFKESGTGVNTVLVVVDK